MVLEGGFFILNKDISLVMQALIKDNVFFIPYYLLIP